jgi:hypothetical protein
MPLSPHTRAAQCMCWTALLTMTPAAQMSTSMPWQAMFFYADMQVLTTPFATTNKLHSICAVRVHNSP